MIHHQVNNLTKRIFHSPILRKDLAELCKKHHLKPLGVVRPVPTRWNSVAMTSRRIIYLEPVIRELVTKASHNVARGPRLLRFKLSEAEWTILKQLDKILAVRPMRFLPFVFSIDACLPVVLP